MFMGNSVIANNPNKIAIAFLLSGSLVYHVKECINARESKSPFPEPGLHLSSAAFTNTLYGSPGFPSIVLSTKIFIKP
jgi:hypothetical protein